MVQLLEMMDLDIAVVGAPKTGVVINPITTGKRKPNVSRFVVIRQTLPF